jgi:hypothetical protein
MSSGSEEGSYSRLIDCVLLNSRLESDKEEEEEARLSSNEPALQGYLAH